jgi:hypothetical protein
MRSDSRTGSDDLGLRVGFPPAVGPLASNIARQSFPVFPFFHNPGAGHHCQSPARLRCIAVQPAPPGAPLGRGLLGRRAAIDRAFGSATVSAAAWAGRCRRGCGGRGAWAGGCGPSCSSTRPASATENGLRHDCIMSAARGEEVSPLRGCGMVLSRWIVFGRCDKTGGL